MAQPANEEKKKKGFWSSFVNFLAYGGFMVILIGVVGVIILVSYLTK